MQYEFTELQETFDKLEKISGFSLALIKHSEMYDIESDYAFLSELVRRNTLNKRVSFGISFGGNASMGLFFKLVHPEIIRYLCNQNTHKLLESLYLIDLTKELIKQWDANKISPKDFVDDLDKCYLYIYDVSFKNNCSLFFGSSYLCNKFIDAYKAGLPKENE